MFLGPANTAGKVESAFVFILVSCVILLAVVTFFMILFLIKYNRKRHPVAEEVKENTVLEIAWTILPTVLVLFMFYFGWVDFEYIRNPPADAMPVHVIARQWSWLFKYQNGKQSDVLNVPLKKDVKLEMTSLDVVHSLFIPAFRIKEDCVPGMTTHLWFNAGEPGSYDIFCTEYCGVGHSHMRSKVVVMTDADFQKWYAAKEKEKGITEEGHELLRDKGCLGCHTVDGTPKIGPTFKSLYGSRVTVMTAGKERTVTADKTYIERSVLKPEYDVVKGFPPIMPKLPVTKQQLETIVQYLETLK